MQEEIEITLTIDGLDSITERWNALSEDEWREQSEAIADLLEDFQHDAPKIEAPLFVTEISPEVRAQLAAEAAKQAKALTALYAQWATEEEEDIDLETLKANMNANRGGRVRSPFSKMSLTAVFFDSGPLSMAARRPGANRNSDD